MQKPHIIVAEAPTPRKSDFIVFITHKIINLRWYMNHERE